MHQVQYVGTGFSLGALLLMFWLSCWSFILLGVGVGAVADYPYQNPFEVVIVIFIQMGH